MTEYLHLFLSDFSFLTLVMTVFATFIGAVSVIMTASMRNNCRERLAEQEQKIRQIESFLASRPAPATAFCMPSEKPAKKEARKEKSASAPAAAGEPSPPCETKLSLQQPPGDEYDPQKIRFV